jgi:excisionase family DNA binding protein
MVRSLTDLKIAMTTGSSTAEKTHLGLGGQKVSSDIISVPEACKFLGVHRNTIYKLIQAGEIPAFRMMTGGRWKFRKSELEQWLEDKQSRARL